MLHLRLALLSTVCLLPYAVTPALAARAGVTAAVNQSAVGTPPGGGIRTVVLGQDVLQDEKIDTTGQGLVQILLADGTTFTVGPNSSLTIDHFVYDPNAGTAQVTASLAKGVFRFIGGRTSKTPNGVTLNTPVGTVGIRGGVADINLNPGHHNHAQFDLLFGQELTFGGRRIYHPGYSIIVGPNGQLELVPTPPRSGNPIQLALTGHPGQTGGSHRVPSDKNVNSSGVPQTNSDHPIGDNTPPSNPPLQPPDFGDTTQTAVDGANGDTTRNNLPVDTGPPLDGRMKIYASGVGSGNEVNYDTSGGSSEPVLLKATHNNDPDGGSYLDFTPGSGSTPGSMGGKIKMKVPPWNTPRFSLGVGSNSPGGSSNYDSNQNYGATGTADGAKFHFGEGGSPSFSDEALTGQTTLTRGITGFTGCTTCAFMQWGAWGADYSGGTSESGPIALDANGYWVGAPSYTSDEQMASRAGWSATYSGQAAGSVISDGQQKDDVTGTLGLTWNFGARSGSIDINNFDGHEMQGTLSETSGGAFESSGGTIIGGGTFNTSGAFANNGSDTAAGVAGNFSAETSGGEWQATGIYVGGRTGLTSSPPPPP